MSLDKRGRKSREACIQIPYILHHQKTICNMIQCKNIIRNLQIKKSNILYAVYGTNKVNV